MIKTSTILGRFRSLFVSGLLLSMVAISAVPSGASQIEDDVERCGQWLSDEIPPLQLLDGSSDDPPTSVTEHCWPRETINSMDEPCAELGDAVFESNAGCDPAQWIKEYCEGGVCADPLSRLTVTDLEVGEPVPVRVVEDTILLIQPAVVNVQINLTTGEGFTIVSADVDPCGVWGGLPMVESCEVKGTILNEDDHVLPFVEIRDYCLVRTYVGLDVFPGTGDDFFTSNAQTVTEC